ncbi:hypothetical protein [Actinoplanes nipponensis]|uniref:hypothetical protein n=1 Tax=Actinoplanes nipponensis TaxID=135950 RepID=UPI00194378C9|nr:hypothetical protein [Actinoplanes nipponensis]
MTETRMTRRERRAIAAEWRRVPFKTRLEVARLAKRGERHPNDAVDAVAVRFSRMALEVPSSSFLYTTTFQALMTLSLLVIAVLWDETFPRWCAGLGGSACLVLMIFNWDLKRDARRILAVHRHNS